MSVSYSIGEVAAITHLSVPTIRYYDKEGLIPDLKKDPAGVRCFDDHNLGALEMINCLKTAGMSIKDIRTFMQWTLEGDTTLEKRLDFFKLKCSNCAKPLTRLNTSSIIIARPLLMARKNTSKPAQPMKKSRGLTKTADDFENVSSLDTQYGIKKTPASR